MREYIAHYNHANEDWNLTFHATDMQDAASKITSIRRSLTLDGEIRMTLRMPKFNWLRTILQHRSKT